MITKQHIELTAKLYRCKDAAKRLFGDEYPSRSEKYKNLIRRRMKDKGLEALTATIEVANELKELAGDGVGLMMLMAAAVDLVEAK